jgi:hypothetical protein
MARRQVSRVEPPPPDYTNMANNNIASFKSFMSQQSASAAAAAAVSSAAVASSLSAQEAQTTSTVDKQTSTYSEIKPQTKETFGITVLVSTPSSSSAEQTDSSTISSSATIRPTQGISISTSASHSAASDHASNYPDSTLQTSNKAYQSGPSAGKIAAAVIIPVICLLTLGFGLFFLRRRQRRRAVSLAGKPYRHHPMTDRSAFSKETAMPRSSPRHPNASATPVLTSATNNSYYTGLSTPTTPSRTSTQTRRSHIDGSPRTAAHPEPSIYDPPPPAYAINPPPNSTPTLPHLFFPTDPFMDPDPVSPISSPTSQHTLPTASALATLTGRGNDTSFTAYSLSPASGIPRPNISRAGTMVSTASVTSDMYSDTASLHSARPARMSRVVGDPFGDPGR